jgi:NOL1/NOP2/fmu family ribosome biogenesis protein
MIFQNFPCSSIPLYPDPKWNIVETTSEKAGAHGYRFFPDKILGEGFFLAVIQKKQTVSSRRLNKLNRNPARISKTIERLISPFIKEGPYLYTSVGESIHALPAGLANDFELMKNSLYLKKAGVRIGKAGENGLIPDHELALANMLKDDTASMDLTKSDALCFLRGDPFETGIRDRGWRVASYLGHRMGWVKLLDKRMNNYYPKSGRIRL